MTIERTDLSVDAVKINGRYIEDIVPGYKTIKSVGRETVDRELDSFDLKGDGALLRSTRYGARQIEVQYVVQRDTMAQMREAMEEVKAALDVIEAEFIFNGDAEYYFTGTPTYDESITEVWNGLVGAFVINCMDPFKYSVAEKEVIAQGGQFNINYDGTYKTYPTLTAEFPAVYDSDGNQTNTSECGYVGFVDAHGDVLQFGDPEQTDWADVVHPATRPLNQKFTSINGWTLNGSQTLTGTQVGTAGITSNHVQASGYGTGTGWHGPSISKIITGEALPVAKNFVFSWAMKLAGTKAQFGMFECLLYNNNSGVRTLVGGVHIAKTTKDTKCNIYMYVNGKNTSYKGIACSKIGSCQIAKSGSTITFSIAGKTNKMVDDAVTDLVANEVVFWFAKKGTQTALSSNYVSNCLLERTEFENNEDIPNTFAPGQILTVDTQNAMVYLDDGSATIDAQSLGALGNDWEDFYLRKGLNIIAADYSDFTTTAPVFKLKYRERFL